MCKKRRVASSNQDGLASALVVRCMLVALYCQHWQLRSVRGWSNRVVMGLECNKPIALFAHPLKYRWCAIAIGGEKSLAGFVQVQTLIHTHIAHGALSKAVR